MKYKDIRKKDMEVSGKGLNVNLLAISILAIALIFLAVAIGFFIGTRDKNEQDIVKTEAENIEETVVEGQMEPENRGKEEPIPDEVFNVMKEFSYKENSNISREELSYLTIPYNNFSGERAVGHMVVNIELAQEVLDIFAELYDLGYPIERMELIDKYGGSDFGSIECNNTSAFNYRESTTGSGKLSKHALGRAIDINPRINPYVNSSGEGSHENAREFWDRNVQNWSMPIYKRAYIGPETEIYRIFYERGWKWGGNWENYRDYQHFEK